MGIGILMFVMAVSQTYLLAKVGAKLTERVRYGTEALKILSINGMLKHFFLARLMTFAGMLQQECGWFDEEEHSVGILASHLGGDAANVQTVGHFLEQIALCCKQFLLVY